MSTVFAAPEPSPLAARLVERVRTHPDRWLLGAAETGWLDGQGFWRRVQGLTHALQRLGLGPGRRLAWLGFNHPLQAAALIACARLGAVFMPLNIRLAPAELRQVLDDAPPTLLVHDVAHAGTAAALGGEGVPTPRGAPWPRLPLESLRWQDEAPHAWSGPAVDGTAPVLLAYTSGTTGRPRGAVHTQDGLLANAHASAWAHDFRDDDLVLSALPLFHVGGLCIQTLPALLSGVPVWLQPRFDPIAWLDAVQRLRPTLSLMVPATMRAVFDHPGWPQTDLSGLRGLMAGSSVVPVAYLEAFHARGVPVGQVYGSTETGPVSVVLRLPEARARVGSVGWPTPQTRVRLIDEAGREVPPGATGELVLQAPNLMRGYGRPDGEPGEGLHEGWFATGDLAQADPDGCLRIVGRRKDMLISGGENVYPAEIENLLLGLPGVAECAVVGLPDARWGEVPVVAVVRSATPEGAALDEATLKAYLSDRIARFKQPRQVRFLEALPKSALGKVLKSGVARAFGAG